jgi:uncharacterized membrane protein
MLTRLGVVFMEHDHAHILRMLGQQGSHAINHVYAARRARGSEPLLAEEQREPVQVIVHEGPPLYIVGLDVERLVRLAHDKGALIRIPFSQGDCVTAGATLALVYGRALPPRRVVAAIALGLERELEVDPKYALRLLVDLALRALAGNDPTTAVQALDQIEALLIRLGNLDLDVGRVFDRQGELRLVYDATAWEEYLELALVEVQHYGAASLQTERRLGALLTFLRDHVPPSRRVAVNAWAEQHEVVVAQALHGPTLLIAMGGDRQGLGHTMH